MLTFHKIITGCEEGRAEAWRAFLTDYTPAVFHFVRMYMPGRPDAAEFWRDALGELCAQNFTILRAFERQSEPEFLAGLRAFLLDKGGAGQEAASVSVPTAGRLSELFKGLPLLHQEVLLLKLAGYSDRTLEQMFRITPAVAQKSIERLPQDYSVALGRQEDRCAYPAAWLKLSRELRAASTADCPPLRQFIRIQDGQVSWYDKEPAERHLSDCLHCLEAWTALREISYWRRAAPEVPAGEIETLLLSLPLPHEAANHKPLFKKLFR